MIPISDSYVICTARGTTLTTPYSVYRIKKLFWIVQVNQKLLLPCLRKQYRAKILQDGKKIGYGEFRCGCPPLPRLYLDSRTPRAIVVNIIRRVFGRYCSKEYKCYYRLKVGKLKFIVIARYSRDGNTVCDIFEAKTAKAVGSLHYTKGCTRMHPVMYYSNSAVLYNALITYLTDTIIFSDRLGALQARVDII